jgi:exodeoxyribonuclease VII large subunit
MNSKPSSVSEALRLIKSQIEGHFRQLSVCGEVSNLSRSSAGHVYFSLIDADSLLSCALFRMDAMRNTMVKDIKNGDQVVCYGGLGVYTKKGTFQLIVKRIEAIGKGDQERELVELKKRLAADGLFDISHKKKIPSLARRVGLITAQGSAAYHDFLQVLDRRSIWVDLLLSPAVVQGDKSASSLRQALERLISYHLSAAEEQKLDVIVITRGGGSLEDLWSFNDEALAWDIFNCPIPVISAVGHEVDFAISDFVADKRCETPTAAAEALSQGQMEIKSKLEQAEKGLKSFASHLQLDMRSKLSRVSPESLLTKIKDSLHREQNKLRSFNILNKLYEFTGYHEQVMMLEDQYNGLLRYIDQGRKLKERLDHQGQVLEALGPTNILKRGYTFVKSDDNVISSYKTFEKLSSQSKLKLFFSDGEGAVVKE